MTSLKGQILCLFSNRDITTTFSTNCGFWNKKQNFVDLNGKATFAWDFLVNLKPVHWSLVRHQEKTIWSFQVQALFVPSPPPLPIFIRENVIALLQRKSLTAKMSHLHFLSGVLDLRLVRDLVFEGLERRPVQRRTSSTINRSSTTEPSTWDWFFLAAKDIRIWSMFDCWYTMKTFLTHQIKGTYMDVILPVHYCFLFPRIFILNSFVYHMPYRQH